MSDNNPPPVNISEVVSRLMQVHVALTSSIIGTANCLAGGLLQLRAHERSLEGHDDIMVIVKDELIAEVKSIYADVLNCLSSDVTSKDTQRLHEQYAAMCDVPIRKRLDVIITKYKPAFKQSKIAPAIMDAYIHNLVQSLDSDIRAIMALFAMSLYAHEVGAINNEKDTLPELLKQSINDGAPYIEGEIDKVFDLVSHDFDEIAKFENQLFEKLTGEGHSESDALVLIHKQTGERVRALLFGQNKADDDESAGTINFNDTE
jgi:hypothetical protein